MEKEFIPYEEALTLKELGFNEPSLMYWNCPVGYKEYNLFLNKNYGNYPYDLPHCKNSIPIYAPLYTQVFNWFREKHNIEGFTTPLISEAKGITFNNRKYQSFVIKEGIRFDSPLYDSYEKAELVCLKKIITNLKEKTL